MIYVSTTYYGAKRSDLQKVLTQINKLDIDGVEIRAINKHWKRKYG